jgi:FkbM family methyltransferase
MTTKFFLYTKQDGHRVQDIAGCQIINPASYAGTILLYPEESIDIHYNHAILEGSLIEWCKEFCSKDGIFLDIGAHTGSYAVCLSPHCHSVYAFEPHERNFYALCGSVALSNRQNIHCFRLGLGSPDQLFEEPILNIQNEDGGNATLDVVDPDKIIRKETIELTTLDIFFANRPLSHPIKFIKIDVENNELEVLKGAVKTIERNGYPKIIFERHPDEDKQKELLGFLNNDLGYHVQPISGYVHMYLATR